MSNINDLVYEGLGGAAIGAGGRFAVNYGANVLGGQLASAGLSSVASAVPLGNIATGLYGAAQQARLNNLKDQYNQINGIQSNPSKFWDYGKVALTGIASSVPIVGGLVNAYKGYQIGNMQNKINQFQNAKAFSNLQQMNPQQQLA